MNLLSLKVNSMRSISSAMARTCLAIGGLLGLLLCVSAQHAAARDEITVSGTDIRKNDKLWVPKGVVVVAFVTPYKEQQSKAYWHYGDEELKAIANFGADLIRFQVSQSYLDPKSTTYDPAYLDKIFHGVQLARLHGFVVIVSVKTRAKGDVDTTGLPDASTVRAWHELTPRFSADRGVMFELFNEPSVPRGQGGRGQQPSWSDWQRTHQLVIDEIRRGGAKNALIVDGLDWAHVLQGSPPLSDPESDLIYGEHPYPKPGYLSPSDWDAAFGNFSMSHPVLVTEWNARAGKHCDPAIPSIATKFLSYAKTHNIGVVGWGFDATDTLFAGDGSMTNYRNFSCGMTGPSGAGELLHAYFSGKS